MAKLNREKNYRGCGYITRHYAAPKALFDCLWQLTAPLGTPGSQNRAERMSYYRFLAHVYVSQLQLFLERDPDIRFEGFVPIYSRLREKEFGRKMNPKLLVDLGIIEIKPHAREKSKSTEYRLEEDTFVLARVIEQKDIKDRWYALMHPEKGYSGTTVNLMNGRKTKTREKHLFQVAETHTSGPIPALVKNAVKAFQPCPFDPWYAGLLVNKLLMKIQCLEKDLKEGKKAEKSREATEKTYERLRGRLINLCACQKAILNQCPTLLPMKSLDGRPLYQYQAAYSVQLSGRITEIGGGFQGAARVFKRSLLRDVPGVYNYDLRSAQAAILAQELKICGIPCSWLDNCLADPNSKEVYAKKIGVPVDVWKKCFYALIMGAIGDNKFGSVYKSLKEYFDGDKTQADNALVLFLKVTKPLNVAAMKWRNYLLEAFDGRYHYIHKGLKHWKNASGMRYKDEGVSLKDGPIIIRVQDNVVVKSRREIEKLKRRLAAFILQGQEACYVHHLSLLCSLNGIPVYKNEHDGLITGKPIPASLMKTAAEKSGLLNCALVEKDLCDSNTLNEWKEDLMLSSSSKSS